MTRRTVLITGANTGIGLATVRQLAAQGFSIVLAGRSKAKTDAAIDEVKRTISTADLQFLPLDLGDLASVQVAATEFEKRGEPLHVLINNAGLARAKEGLTAQGFETTFGTNHLGHFLLTLLLKPALERAGSSRVVMVASRASERVRRFSLEGVRQPTATYMWMRQYGHSKLANVLFSKALARRWASSGVHTYALHPGVIASDIWRRIPWPLRPLLTGWMKTVEEGATASVHCASSPQVAQETGRYYGEDGGPRRCNPLADDVALQDELWDRSLEWVGPWLNLR